ncbi:MAG: hypothetical protein [Circular genetic element sp.]|nr:MAG: hypothetical protein [Circular genetic element sp.]
MAKSDTFFIRASVDPALGVYDENTIDLGSFVNALSKDVLRIWSVECRYPQPSLNATGAAALVTETWQLTTQPQTGIVPLTNRSLIASGQLTAAWNTGAVSGPESTTQEADIGPQDWKEGYLVAVEQLYFGGLRSAPFSPNAFEIVLECTSETMTTAAAMALALSQQ